MTHARTAYQHFLTLWKDADSDVPILTQARAEAARASLTNSGDERLDEASEGDVEHALLALPRDATGRGSDSGRGLRRWRRVRSRRGRTRQADRALHPQEA